MIISFWVNINQLEEIVKSLAQNRLDEFNIVVQSYIILFAQHPYVGMNLKIIIKKTKEIEEIKEFDTRVYWELFESFRQDEAKHIWQTKSILIGFWNSKCHQHYNQMNMIWTVRIWPLPKTTESECQKLVQSLMHHHCHLITQLLNRQIGRPLPRTKAKANHNVQGKLHRRSLKSTYLRK